MHKLEYYLVVILFRFFQWLPRSAAKRFAQVFSIVIGQIIRYRRRVVRDNLNLVYGTDWPFEKTAFIKAVYKHFTFLWIELLQMAKLDASMLNRYFTIHGGEVLDEALQKKRGVILISGHFGNFEWLGQMHAFLGYKINGIAKKQSNPYVNDFVYNIRRRNGVGIIYTKRAMKEAIEVLKRNEIVGIVNDQDAGKKGLFVQFMGRPSSTAAGSAVLHLRTGAPLIFIAAIRRDFGQFDVYYEKIYDAGEPQEVTTEKIIEITQQYVTRLEKWVRQYPEQWFWMHRRWKTRPVY